MSTGSTWRRLGLWRVTRSPLARGVYDRLTAAGVHVGRLDRFVRDAEAGVEERVDPSPVDDVRVRRASEGPPAGLADDPLAPDDRVVTAWIAGRRIGYCVLSDRSTYVPALDRRLSFSGAYVWRVFVERGERGRGIGTAIVAAAVGAAASEFGADTVSALVAPDNVPSRRAFGGLGFEPRERYTTVAVGGLVWTRGEPPP